MAREIDISAADTAELPIIREVLAGDEGAARSAAQARPSAEPGPDKQPKPSAAPGPAGQAKPAAEPAAGTQTKPAAAPGASKQAKRSAAPAATAPKSAKRRRRRVRPWHIVAGLIVLALIAAVVAASLFIWTRWYRYDDSQDIKGTWYALGTSVPVQVNDDTIDFTIDTTYSYTIDESAKTIKFWLGGLEGLGHYRFDDDRQVLIITDGEGFTQWGTAGDDLLGHFSDFTSLSAGKGIHYPSGEGVIVLTREPDKQGKGDVKYKKAGEGK